MGLHGLRFRHQRPGRLALQEAERAAPVEAFANGFEQGPRRTEGTAELADVDVSMVERVVQGGQPTHECASRQDVIRVRIIFVNVWRIMSIKETDARTGAVGLGWGRRVLAA